MFNKSIYSMFRVDRFIDNGPMEYFWGNKGQANGEDFEKLNFRVYSQ